MTNIAIGLLCGWIRKKKKIEGTMLGIIDGWIDDCIEAQWGLYIGYMKETLNYNITIITLTIIPLTQVTRLFDHVLFTYCFWPPSLQEQLENIWLGSGFV
jgi:hypothetical protein